MLLAKQESSQFQKSTLANKKDLLAQAMYIYMYNIDHKDKMKTVNL